MEGGGGCRHLEMSVGGGVEVLRPFCHFWDPEMTVSACFTPPQMGFLTLWDPQMTVSGCSTPPPRWKICHSDVPQVAGSGCFTPPFLENLSFWHPQMTVSGCLTPPADGTSVILGFPDDSFWVFYPP